MKKLLFLLLFPIAVFAQPRYDLIDQTKIYGGTGTWIVTGSGTAVDTIKPSANGQYLVSKAAAPGFEFQTFTPAAVDTSDIANFYVKVRSLFSANTPATYSSGIIGVDTTTVATGLATQYDLSSKQDRFTFVLVPHPQFNPADNQNYFAASPTIGPGLVEANTSYRYVFSRDMVIEEFVYHSYLTILAGTAETATIYWRNSTDATDATISTTVTYNTLKNKNTTTGLSIAITAGKDYMLKTSMPTFVTNPQGVNVIITITGHYVN